MAEGRSEQRFAQTDQVVRSEALVPAGLGFEQRRQRKLEERLARRVLVLPASVFEHLFEEGPAELAYAGTPVSGLTQHEQGRICQEWARKLLQEQNPLTQTQMFDPEPQTFCKGRKSGSYQAGYDYDFLMGGRRVEIKSQPQWYVHFACGKTGARKPPLTIFSW